MVLLICFFAFTICTSNLRSILNSARQTQEEIVNEGCKLKAGVSNTKKKKKSVNRPFEVKTAKSWTIAAFRKNLQADVVNDIGQNGSPRPTLRKQNHMCRLIHKVLTLGPERICILLGKCFPLGSVSATAYRCFDRAERAWLFPPRHEWKSMLKVFLQPSYERDLQLILRCTLQTTISCTGRGLILMLFSAASQALVQIVLHTFVKLATLQRQMSWQQRSEHSTAQESINNVKRFISMFLKL